jgi:putative oxidoreductase
MHRIVAIATLVTDLAGRVARGLEWLPPTLARVVVGWLFFVSGWGKLNDLESVAGFFAELGIPAPYPQAVLASSAEFVCGGLLLLGLATRFAVVPLIITMLVALRTALWDQVTDPVSLFGISEFLYIVLFVWLGVSGAGPLSLDAVIARLARGDASDSALPRGAARVAV